MLRPILVFLLAVVASAAIAADALPQFPGQIIGASDGTQIGNVADRLKVTCDLIDGDIVFIDPVPGRNMKPFLKTFANGSDTNMADSSYPTNYIVAPATTAKWYIYEVTMYVDKTYGFSTSKLCNASALTNGLRLEIYSDGGAAHEIVNIKINSDLETALNPARDSGGSQGIVGSMKFNVPVLLDASKSDKIQWTVRDNISSCVHIQSMAAGFVQ